MILGEPCRLPSALVCPGCSSFTSIIFCTAYDSYALKAFEVNAVDYLLKPVRAERLAEALSRARQRGQKDLALDTLAPPSPTRVIASTRGEARFFDTRGITRFWASEKYTLFLAEGEEQMTEESLSSLEARLGTTDFMRVHRAELVRLSAVTSLRHEDEGAMATLSDGQQVRLSRRSVTAVKEALGLR